MKEVRDFNTFIAKARMLDELVDFITRKSGNVDLLDKEEMELIAIKSLHIASRYKLRELEQIECEMGVSYNKERREQIEKEMEDRMSEDIKQRIKAHEEGE